MINVFNHNVHIPYAYRLITIYITDVNIVNSFANYLGFSFSTEGQKKQGNPWKRAQQLPRVSPCLIILTKTFF